MTSPQARRSRARAVPVSPDHDLLIINKTDLAPHVGADLGVMDRDATKMRKTRPFVFANMKAGEGIESVVEFIVQKGGLNG